MVHRFPEKQYAHFIAVLWIGANYVIFRTSFAGWLETFTLLNFIVVFVYHIYIVENESVPFWHYVLYAFALASLFSIKRSSIILGLPFLGHLFLLRKWKHFLLVLLPSTAFLGTWYFVRHHLMAFPPLDSFSGAFPFEGTDPFLSNLSLFVFSPRIFLDHEWGVIKSIININMLGLLTPFALFFIVKYPNDHDKQIVCLVLLTLLTVMGIMNYPIIDRHVFPFIVPAIIYAAVAFEQTILNLRKDIRGFMAYALVASMVFILIMKVSDFSKRVYYHSTDRNMLFKAIDELLRDNQVPDSAVILTNIVGYNLYSDHGYVLAPLNINSSRYPELLDLYKVDYVLHCVGYTSYIGWTEYTLMTDIYGDLPLIATSDVYPELRLYSVK
jgi:hypothetical protein